MVKLEDGFKKEQERWKKADLIAKLATGIFGDNRLSCPPYERRININEGSGTGSVALIDCGFNEIEVRRERDYENCLRLAEECEKALKQEFTLTTTYERTVVPSIQNSPE